MAELKDSTINGNPVWHAGNDGTGSGLDADTLDGLHASSLLSSNGAITKTDTVYANSFITGAMRSSGAEIIQGSGTKVNCASAFDMFRFVGFTTNSSLILELSFHNNGTYGSWCRTVFAINFYTSYVICNNLTNNFNGGQGFTFYRPPTYTGPYGPYTDQFYVAWAGSSASVTTNYTLHFTARHNVPGVSVQNIGMDTFTVY